MNPAVGGRVRPIRPSRAGLSRSRRFCFHAVKLHLRILCERLVDKLAPEAQNNPETEFEPVLQVRVTVGNLVPIMELH